LTAFLGQKDNNGHPIAIVELELVAVLMDHLVHPGKMVQMENTVPLALLDPKECMESL